MRGQPNHNQIKKSTKFIINNFKSLYQGKNERIDFLFNKM